MVFKFGVKFILQMFRITAEGVSDPNKICGLNITVVSVTSGGGKCVLLHGDLTRLVNWHLLIYIFMNFSLFTWFLTWI